MSLGKADRLAILVALCVKNGRTPRHTAFCDFILQASAAHFHSDKRTAKSYVRTLIDCYKFNRWKTLVKGNPNLKTEEKEQWMTIHSQK